MPATPVLAWSTTFLKFMTALADREFDVLVDDEFDTADGGGARPASVMKDMADPVRGMEKPTADPWMEEPDTEEAAGGTRRPGWVGRGSCGTGYVW
jgi:hypothetical protein